MDRHHPTILRSVRDPRRGHIGSRSPRAHLPAVRAGCLLLRGEFRERRSVQRIRYDGKDDEILLVRTRIFLLVLQQL
jgi:hypothetical protein